VSSSPAAGQGDEHPGRGIRVCAVGGGAVDAEGATRWRPVGRSHDSDESVKTHREETSGDKPAMGEGAGEAEEMGSESGGDCCGVWMTGRA